MSNATPVSNTELLLLVVGFIIFVAAFFGGLLWLIVKDSRKATANLRALAEQLGLEFAASKGLFKTGAKAMGTLRGKPVEVFTFTTGAGNSRATWAAVSARPTSTGGLTFTLSGRNLLTKMGEWFGRHGLVSGDPDFDATWFVQSNGTEFLTTALLPELRVKLMAAHAAGSHGSFTLADDLVKYAEIGRFSDAARCARIPALMDIVCDLADIAEVAPDSDGSVPRG